MHGPHAGIYLSALRKCNGCIIRGQRGVNFFGDRASFYTAIDPEKKKKGERLNKTTFSEICGFSGSF